MLRRNYELFAGLPLKTFTILHKGRDLIQQRELRVLVGPDGNNLKSCWHCMCFSPPSLGLNLSLSPKDRSLAVMCIDKDCNFSLVIVLIMLKIFLICFLQGCV